MKRARDHGLAVGDLATGPGNAITDVPGVRVGHVTRREGDRMRTGVTAIWPHGGNPFRDRVLAATSVLNGYGIMTGMAVIAEWGMLGSPIVLTNTPSVGNAYEGVVRHLMELDPDVGVRDVAMPVVAECDDGYLNDHRLHRCAPEDAIEALRCATGGAVAEGCVGAGTGTALFGFKGGIGTASRRVTVYGRPYTVGVLLQTNFGARGHLTVLGHPVGRWFPALPTPAEGKGSCIGIAATDAPLDPGQLRRIAKRVGLGLVRTGSFGSDGSGELFLAFSTAVTLPREPGRAIPVERLVDGQFRSATGGSAPANQLLEAAVEASEEAVLNALVAARTTEGRDGHVLEAFPVTEAVSRIGRARA